jgi:hypothetical protein
LARVRLGGRACRIEAREAEPQTVVKAPQYRPECLSGAFRWRIRKTAPCKALTRLEARPRGVRHRGPAQPGNQATLRAVPAQVEFLRDASSVTLEAILRSPEIIFSAPKKSGNMSLPCAPSMRRSSGDPFAESIASAMTSSVTRTLIHLPEFPVLPIASPSFRSDVPRIHSYNLLISQL